MSGETRTAATITVRAAGRGRWIYHVTDASGAVLLGTNDLAAALRAVRRSVCGVRAAITLGK